MATSPSASAGTILQGLMAQFAGDVLVSAKGLLTNFGSAITANPSQENVIAQALALAATAPLQLPNLESQAIAQFGTAVQQLAALIPSSVSSSTAAPSSK